MSSFGIGLMAEGLSEGCHSPNRTTGAASGLPTPLLVERRPSTSVPVRADGPLSAGQRGCWRHAGTQGAVRQLSTRNGPGHGSCLRQCFASLGNTNQTSPA